MSAGPLTDEAPAVVASARPATRRHDRVVMAIAAVPIAAYLFVAVRRLGYPYELEWMEGGSLEWIRGWADGGAPLYGPPSLERTPWAYPPLYPALSAAVAQLTGWGLLPLRLVSLLASLVALGLLVALGRRLAGGRVAGVTAAGVYAATYLPSGLWFDTGRVDSLLVALLLAAIWTALRANGIGGGIALGVLLTLAAATKQNALFLAAPLLLGLLLTRRRAGIAATATHVLLLLGGVALAQAWTDGWFGDYVIGLLLGHPIVAHQVVTFWLVDLGALLAPTMLLLVVAARRQGVGRTAIAMVRSRGWASGHPDAVLVGLAVVGLLGAGWVGRLHSGGAANVLMPAYAAYALLAGLAVAALSRPEPTPHAERTARQVVGFALTAQVAVSVPFFGAALPSGADRVAGQEVVAAIARLPGRVLLLDHPHYLTLAGQAPNAHLVAVGDLLRGPDSRARAALVASIPATLRHIDVVLLDRADDEAILGPELTRDFARVDTPGTAQAGVFWPVGGVDGRPSIVWVRRGVVLDPATITALVAPR